MHPGMAWIYRRTRLHGTTQQKGLHLAMQAS